jgi:hypothetical protein
MPGQIGFFAEDGEPVRDKKSYRYGRTPAAYGRIIKGSKKSGLFCANEGVPEVFL